MKKLITTLILFLSMNVSAAIIPATLYGESVNNDNLWTFTDTSLLFDDAGFFLNAEFGAFNSGGSRSFGLYQYDLNNGSMLNTLQIFDSTTLATGSATANVVLDVATQMLSTSYGSIDTSLAAGLAFGFYFSSDGFTAYSQESFNAGNEDFFGFYTETDPFSVFNTHLYAVDNDSGSNLDWLKMSISDIRTGSIQTFSTPTPVPEPSMIGLFALATLMFGFKKRET